MVYHATTQATYYANNAERKKAQSKARYEAKKCMCCCGGNRNTKEHFDSSNHKAFHAQIYTIGILRNQDGFSIRKSIIRLYVFMPSRMKGGISQATQKKIKQHKVPPQNK